MPKIVRVATRNWRTTLAGVIAAVLAIGDGVMKLIDSDPLTNPDYQLIIAATIAAVGLMFARDAMVTSKQLGLDK